MSDTSTPTTNETACAAAEPIARTPSPKPRRKRGVKQRQPRAVAGVGQQFVSPDGACELLGCNRATLRRLEERGVLRPVRISHTVVRYRLSDLQTMETP